MVATLKDVDRPRDVDTTSALALMLSYRKNNWIIVRKGVSTKMDLVGHSNNHPTGEAEVPKSQQAKGGFEKIESENKLESLKVFRRKNRLCFKHGEKWRYSHKCPAQISLHVLEELSDAIELVDQPNVDSYEIE